MTSAPKPCSASRDEMVRHTLDVPLALFLGLRELLHDLAITLRVQELEGQIFELALEQLDAQAVGEGGVDLERLARDALLPLGAHVLQRAHVVQAVAQLDEQDANVLRHRHDHLAEALGLAIFFAGEVDLAELGDAVDQVRDLVPELAGDVVPGGAGVFHHVVEQAGAH